MIMVVINLLIECSARFARLFNGGDQFVDNGGDQFVDRMLGSNTISKC